MCTLSVVIPIYFEEENIPVLYERLLKVVQKIDVSYEFIFVNDGSTDRSMELIKGLGQKDSHVKFIDLSRNFGHQIAVTAGLDVAKGKAVVIIDADLQDPPEVIEELYQKYLEGVEVVYAKRRNRKGETFFKKFTAKAFYRILAKMTSHDIPLDTGDFRLIDHKVVKALQNMPEQSKFLRGQIAWVGFKQDYVLYDRDSRHAGETGYTFKKMFRFAMDGITGFSNLPLRIATVMGFIVSGIAFLVMLWALYNRFIQKSYQPGWTSTILSILFIGGIQLISIGIIGEYIKRIADNVRDRPIYVVRDSNVEKGESSSSKSSSNASSQ